MPSWIPDLLASLIGAILLIGFGWFAFSTQRQFRVRGTLPNTPGLERAHRVFVASVAVTALGCVLLLAHRSGGPAVFRPWGVGIAVAGQIALVGAFSVVLRERFRAARERRGRGRKLP